MRYPNTGSLGLTMQSAVDGDLATERAIITYAVLRRAVRAHSAIVVIGRSVVDRIPFAQGHARRQRYIPPLRWQAADGREACLLRDRAHPPIGGELPAVRPRATSCTRAVP